MQFKPYTSLIIDIDLEIPQGTHIIYTLISEATTELNPEKAAEALRDIQETKHFLHVFPILANKMAKQGFKSKIKVVGPLNLHKLATKFTIKLTNWYYNRYGEAKYLEQYGV